MACPLCVVSAMVGGIVGKEWLGINEPKSRFLRIVMSVLTVVLVAVSVFGLMCLLDLTIYGPNGDLNVGHIVSIGAISIVSGGIYSMALNFLFKLIGYTFKRRR